MTATKITPELLDQLLANYEKLDNLLRLTAVEVVDVEHDAAKAHDLRHRQLADSASGLWSAPMCRLCRAKGLIMPARVADHIEWHDGDQNKFWFGQLQSLCTECHNRSKQQLEVRGYIDDIGADGFPTDPRHPFNAHK